MTWLRETLSIVSDHLGVFLVIVLALGWLISVVRKGKL